MELLGVLAVLFISLLFIGAIVAAIGLVLKVALWTVLLPIRLLFWLLLLPFLLLKFLIGGVLLLALGPIVVIGAVVGVIALVAVLVAPLLPLAILAALVWLLVRAARPAVA